MSLCNKFNAKVAIFIRKGDAIDKIMLTLPAKLTNVMKLVRKPWVWLSRFRYRRGYGVHSPFAYAFIRGVLLETWPYYAYDELERRHPWLERKVLTYPVRCRRMLFRVANAVHPATMATLGDRPLERDYMSAGVASARWTDDASSADLVFIAHEQLCEAPSLLPALPHSATLICEGIYEDGEACATWQAVKSHARTTLTFDLYTYGIALLDRPLNRHNYKVNF